MKFSSCIDILWVLLYPNDLLGDQFDLFNKEIIILGSKLFDHCFILNFKSVLIKVGTST